MNDLTDEELEQLRRQVALNLRDVWYDDFFRLLLEVRRHRAHKCKDPRGPSITASIGKDGLINFGFEE